ncbi:MAG: class I adenylate-forming enzyme family protein [Campylobacterota bacterium]|nr:class I adenylate-forming enzyme family protein [Campylobacterota bacterium]
MKNLLDIITKISKDKNKIAFICEDKIIKYLDILDIYKQNKIIIDTLKGKSVCIRSRQTDEFILLLSLLDGFVEKILFLPSDIDEKLIDNYYEKSSINYEVYMKDNKLSYNVLTKNKNKKNVIQTKWIIPTSGTTSTPKLISHTLESLTRTTKSDTNIGNKFIWGLVFDIYRFSGIQVFLQSLLSGSKLLIPTSHLNLENNLTFFIKNGCNIISATPSFFRKALMCKSINELKLNSITLGGEIVDQHIINGLKKIFPNASIRHIYASTEVGVGFSVVDGKAGFSKKYLDDGVNGIKLKVNKEGILLIKPNHTYNEYIDSGDLIKIENDRVYFLGRASGAINVGGNKVQPEEIENILLNCNLVHSAFVYAKNNPIMGSLVCANIVLKDNKTDKIKTKKVIINFCKQHLENFKIPALLKIVDDIKITQSGKLKR